MSIPCRIKRTIGNHVFKFVLFGFMALLVSSCAKEEENDNPYDTVTPDEYYIRYELETTFIGRDREMIVTVIDDKDAPLVYNMRSGMDMDVIIGPVSKGFTA